jgi:hypothetical protein
MIGKRLGKRDRTKSVLLDPRAQVQVRGDLVCVEFCHRKRESFVREDCGDSVSWWTTVIQAPDRANTGSSH